MRQSRQPARRSVNFASVREARTNSAPGRARHKPSDHRAGKAVCWASPVCCCAVFCVCSMRSRPRVPAGTRPSLCPLAQEGERRSKARANSAARTRRHVCKLKCGVGTAMAPVLRNCELEPGLRSRRALDETLESLQRHTPDLLRCARNADVLPGGTRARLEEILPLRSSASLGRHPRLRSGRPHHPRLAARAGSRCCSILGRSRVRSKLVQSSSVSSSETGAR
ncbi:hypothetical protein EDE08_105102 [Bradyrhizobium sp. R2.2-H]|nr:hypothetical protein EDE10_105102 [Bradyrhizobium sp. Y-H1]TCU74364.1 hypothetical protein EDE08_105102 [Bradyrhizobium sp. R2.2-H]